MDPDKPDEHQFTHDILPGTIEYGDYKREVGTPLDFSLVEDKQRKIIAVLNKQSDEKIPVSSANVEKWTAGQREVKNDSLNQKREKDERLLKDMVRETLLGRMWSDLQEQHETEKQFLDTDSDVTERDPLSGDERTQAWNELNEDAKAEAENWFDGIVKAGLPLERYDLEFQGGVVISVVRVGRQPEERGWQTNLRMLQNIHEIRNKLLIDEPPQNLTVIELYDLQLQRSEIKGEPGITEAYSCAANIIGRTGLADLQNNTVVLAPHADKALGEEGVTLKLDSDYMNRITRHELTHWMDPNKASSTIIQKESLAMLADMNFDFRNSLDYMRNKVGYKNDVTAEHLTEIFNDDRPIDQLPYVRAEYYFLTGTFNSFFYEKFGKEAFKDYFDLLTGGHLVEGGTLVERSKVKSLSLAEDHKCDFRGALDFVLKKYGSGTDSQELLDEFVKAVN